MSPPIALLPVFPPAVNVTDPEAEPAVAVPDLSEIVPDEPLSASPDAISIFPLLLVECALEEEKFIAPLVPVSLPPLVTVIEPPVLDEDVPA